MSSFPYCPMPRKPLEGLPSPKNGRMASWHRAVRESFKFQIKAMDKSYFYASNIP
ncbi:hypothetical protein [Arsenophonus nasoniae]|uniref:hypothetical protein n=1 Tax=Arsenophonus nasoniae TaxID=638 RepID=UPI003879F589